MLSFLISIRVVPGIFARKPYLVQHKAIAKRRRIAVRAGDRLAMEFGPGLRLLLESATYTKSLPDIRRDLASSQLPRVLGPGALIMIGVGVILGGGIFVLVGTVASNAAGPAAALSFLITAGGCGLIALCYAELAAMLPAPGGGYTYAYATFGEAAAWFVGWNLVLEYVFAGAFVSVGWSGYLGGFLTSFGIHLPWVITDAPLKFADGHFIASGSYINLPAIVIAFLVAMIVVRGISISAMVSTLIVSLKLLALALFVAAGARYVHASNWSPFVPTNQGHFGAFGWSGILRGSAIVFIAYLGFDAIATTARECRSPQRDVPIGIFGSLAVCGIFYSLVALILTGLVSYQRLDVANPLSVALRAVGGPLDWLAPLIEVAALAGLAAVLLGILVAQPRIVMAMSADGLLPQRLATLHPRFRTPARATMMTSIVVALLAAFFPLDLLSQLVSMGALCVFTSVCAGVLVLRRRSPDERRAFRTPAARIVAPAGIAFCLIMLAALPRASWSLYVVWIAIGSVIYLCHGHRAAAAQRLAR
jgi:basic amino acid/polyamine antiporter, APA family